jgi:hypothetical protein
MRLRRGIALAATFFFSLGSSAQDMSGEPPCRRPNHNQLQPRVVGLMVTKDDQSVMAEWLNYNMPSLRGLVLFDSSRGVATKQIVEAYTARCLAAIVYMREDELKEPLTRYSDQAMRYWPLKALRQRFGAGNWVLVAHPDEFCYHEPELVARAIELRLESGRERTCQAVRWHALPVVPHPSEYGRFVAGPAPLVQTRFQHVHSNFTWRASSWDESRLFKDSGADYDRSSRAREQSTVPPDLVTCGWRGPTLLHYKIVQPDIATYQTNGKHRSHWKVGRHGKTARGGFTDSRLRTPCQLDS